MEKNWNFFMYFWVCINFRIKRFLYIQVFVNQGFFYICFSTSFFTELVSTLLGSNEILQDEQKN